MAFIIHTYEDPYKIDQTDFWESIAELPHFCSARTLTNGLKDVLKDKIKGLICPLDTLVKHEDIYMKWTDNIGLRVQQYSAISTIFKSLHDKGHIDDNFYLSLTQNQTHFLEAIRLFIELGISASALDETKGNREQKLFVNILKKLQKTYLFKFPKTPNTFKIKNTIDKIAVQEIEECRGPEREIERCTRAAELTKQIKFNAIVVHGVHQFSTAQIRFLTDLEKMGIDIIFIYNYQKKYSKIYSSWTDIYECFDAEILHDKNIKEYQIPTMQNPSNALACAIGKLCEENSIIGKDNLKEWYKLFKTVPFREFSNITEYAHYVSDHFDAAIERCKQSQGVMERGNGVWSNAAVLSFLDEQVYTANRDVHTLLKIYFPEYAKDRHFLSYPIGQFFSAIYRLWNFEKKSIDFSIPEIKECLSSNILSAAPGEVLLKTFNNVDVIFENITSFDEFKTEIEKKYFENYNTVVNSKSTDVVFPLKQLSIYNKYRVAKQDVSSLIKAINEINEIAKYLFSLDNTHEDYINFGNHFHNLEEFLKQRELALANEQERALINALQLRLDKIKPEQSVFSGTFRDLKEGLHFYLKQKNDEDQGVDWIVKNFEQIDGDILQSKGQFEKEKNKIYHFACLSDRDMNMSVNDQLPWPLSDDYIQMAYAPIDLQFQVYYTSMCERSNFLRYAFFYGLFYNRCDVSLSFVKQYGDEITEPYSLLSILGFEAKGGPVDKHNGVAPFSINVTKENVPSVQYDRFKMMDVFLCPYRYFLDYIMGESPVITGKFLYQKYYENLIVDAVWKRISDRTQEEASTYLSRIIDEESNRINGYFSFWKSTEIFDLKRRAYNYLTHEIITAGYGNNVRNYTQSHMQMRKQFGTAKFVTDITEKEPVNDLKNFEQLSKRIYPQKEYSLHKLPKPEQAQQIKVLCGDVMKYINQMSGKENLAIPSDWCTFCVNRGICMKYYLSTN